MGFKCLAVMSVLALTVAAAPMMGCADDETTMPTSSSSGASSSSSSSSSGATSSSSSSSGGASGQNTTPEKSLYERLGKRDGIKGALDKILEAVLADPDIASYFVFVGKDGHPPSAAVIQECLIHQLGSAAGGPASEVKYPTTVTVMDKTFACRDMKSAHAGLGIPPKTFDKFVTIAAGELKKLGVPDADITTIGSVLTGTKTDVVTDSSREEGPFKGVK